MFFFFLQGDGGTPAQGGAPTNGGAPAHPPPVGQQHGPPEHMSSRGANTVTINIFILLLLLLSLDLDGGLQYHPTSVNRQKIVIAIVKF